MKRMFRCLALFLIALSLVFSACPEVPSEETGNPWFIGDWHNGKDGDDEKSFTVKSDFSFTCLINPGVDGNYQGKGEVEGKLVYDGNNIYTLAKMVGTPKWPGSWTQPLTLGSFNSEKVLVTFSNENEFKLISVKGDKDAVSKFFGGDYYRVSE
jgi:hypothetical protein